MVKQFNCPFCNRVVFDKDNHPDIRKDCECGAFVIEISQLFSDDKLNENIKFMREHNGRTEYRISVGSEIKEEAEKMIDNDYYMGEGKSLNVEYYPIMKAKNRYKGKYSKEIEELLIKFMDRRVERGKFNYWFFEGIRREFCRVISYYEKLNEVRR